MSIDFRHRHSAHCESGVTSNLLTHHGFQISEPLAFGIGSGLFFGFLPFIKINNYPLVFFRSYPGGILKRVSSRLGARLNSSTFWSQNSAMEALDRALDSGIPVVLQTSVYWLPYFPPALRFHFNAHHLVVYGREAGEYLISDPVFDEPVRCDAASLRRARFAEGALSPRGKMYMISNVQGEFDRNKAVIKGIGEVCNRMLINPFPLLGIRGMRYLSREIVKWPSRYGAKKAGYYLGHLVRMQEEVGTGGGGFRFLYSAFMQEASEILKTDRLRKVSNDLTLVGDTWREFGLAAIRISKSRNDSGMAYADLSSILLKCADMEEGIFRDLKDCLRSI